MQTVLYIMRHAEKLDVVGEDHRRIDDLEKNKAIVLTVKGELQAQKLSTHEAMQDVDILWASDYVRTIQTAKYIAKNNDLMVNIHPNLGERVKGTTNLHKYDFAYNQWKDPHYKTEDGESREEVNKRMNSFMKHLLMKYQGSKIAVVSHTTSLNFWLSNWCHTDLETKEIYYKDKVIADEFRIKKASLYKLTFDPALNLLDIEYLNEKI